ncbi:hypothetical protein [Shewanella chilikensis]|uniref:Uncharacterized protein n=1 Tax=Shewanella chilikensis TaxID=558541 RepID=A0A6G7LUU1_9GAMM|nr:hypothetical protein [Shewanella chilikensis]QIJ05521.1 hypothetical protein GII14_16145 [Shewanella chilikensis]
MEMINLSGHILNSLPLGDLTWKRDLIYFEGPLLSEFVSERGEIFLKYWCDCDNQYNRWIYFKIKEQDRLRLVQGEISLYQVMRDQPDSYFFFADENESSGYFKLVPESQVPNEYFPEEDSFLDVRDYTEDESVTSLLFEDEWDFEDLKTLYRKFIQAYDFLYLSVNSSQRLNNSMPWQGGFSTVHFFNKIKDLIPSGLDGSLNSIHYASPGYMKLRTDSNVSRHLLFAVKHYMDNRNDVDTVYLELSNRIRELELNKMAVDSARNSFVLDVVCMRLYQNLFQLLPSVDNNWLRGFVDTDFERCKILMAYVRRLRSIDSFLNEKNVRVVTSIFSDQ